MNPSVVKTKKFIQSLFRNIGKHNLELIAPGVAFFMFLSLFPILSTLISIFSFFISEENIPVVLDFLSILPEGIVEIIKSQIEFIIHMHTEKFIAVFFSLFFALWSGREAINGLTVALNHIYGVKEERSFIKKNTIAFLLTLAGIIISLILFSALAIIPIFIHFLGLQKLDNFLIHSLRWSTLCFGIIIYFNSIYHFAPSQKLARRNFFSFGSLISTLIWLGATGIFSWYVANFGKFNQIYGSLGAIVILLLWLSLTSFVILLGAEIDVQIKGQSKETKQVETLKLS